MELAYRTMLAKGSHNVTDSESIKITNRSDTGAAGYLMNMCLKEGSSVVIYGRAAAYYDHVFRNCPPAVREFDTQSLAEDINWPYIKDMEPAVRQTMAQILMQNGMPVPLYEEAQKERAYPDPSVEQCFYHIKPPQKGSSIMTETFLTGILYQRRCQEPLRDVWLFMDAPFYPVVPLLRESFGRLTAGIRVIYMYERSDGSPDASIEMYSEGGDITFVYMGKGRRIYEQD